MKCKCIDFNCVRIPTNSRLNLMDDGKESVSSAKALESYFYHCLQE